MGQGQLIETEGVLTGPTMGIKGFGRFVLRDKMSRVLQDTGWIPNVITNAGMLRIRDGVNPIEYCQIGTSTAAPAETDVNCTSPIGTRVLRTGIVQAWVGTTYSYRRQYGRFLEGNGTGAIAEAAWFNSSSGGSAFCHYRIVDSGGNPTVINKGADQILDVYYEIRNYGKQTDQTGTVDISGTAYNYTMRACRLGNASTWADGTAREYVGGTVDATGYSGNIGPNTGTPSGTASVGVTPSIIGVGTYYNDVQLEGSLDQWNFGGGLRSLRFKTGNCEWQVQYGSVVGDLAIPKTNEKRLRLKFRLSWVRL